MERYPRVGTYARRRINKELIALCGLLILAIVSEVHVSGLHPAAMWKELLIVGAGVLVAVVGFLEYFWETGSYRLEERWWRVVETDRALRESVMDLPLFDRFDQAGRASLYSLVGDSQSLREPIRVHRRQEETGRFCAVKELLRLGWIRIALDPLRSGRRGGYETIHFTEQFFNEYRPYFPFPRNWDGTGDPVRMSLSLEGVSAPKLAFPAAVPKTAH